MLEVFLFFGVPIAMVVCFGISLYRYLHAKKLNKINPDTFTTYQIENRKATLIVFTVLAALFTLLVVGFILLLNIAIAYM